MIKYPALQDCKVDLVACTWKIIKNVFKYSCDAVIYSISH